MDWEQTNGRRRLEQAAIFKQTAKFSALALFRSPLAVGEVAPTGTPPDPTSSHLLMLGDWGTATEPGKQNAVANAMKRWVSVKSIRPDALLMLGDNFYGDMPDGVKSGRWIRQFEQM